MGQAILVRTDYTAGEVRRFAQRAKDAGIVTLQGRAIRRPYAAASGKIRRLFPGQYG